MDKAFLRPFYGISSICVRYVFDICSIHSIGEISKKYHKNKNDRLVVGYRCKVKKTNLV